MKFKRKKKFHLDTLIDENKKYENEIQALKDINEKTEKINSNISSE